MSLESRVARLEQSNRRLRFVATLMAIGFVGLAALGAADDDKRGIVRATELQIVNGHGEIRAMLAADDLGCRLVMNGNGVAPAGGQKQDSIVIHASENGGAGVTVIRDGIPRGQIIMERDDDPRFEILDEDGEVAWSSERRAAVFPVRVR